MAMLNGKIRCTNIVDAADSFAVAYFDCEIPSQKKARRPILLGFGQDMMLREIVVIPNTRRVRESVFRYPCVDR